MRVDVLRWLAGARGALHVIILTQFFVVLPPGLFDLADVDPTLGCLFLFNEEFETDHPKKHDFTRLTLLR